MCAAESTKRFEVQVVVVGVRDQNQIDLRKIPERNSRFAESRDVITESPAKDRVGENADATLPEKNCCMVDESQRMQNS